MSIYLDIYTNIVYNIDGGITMPKSILKELREEAKLSQDVYTALNNIKGMAEELGGGRSKKAIDSTTEYNKLAQLLAGNGDVARSKMTETDIKTLEAELANAEKWKPAGDEFEKETEKNDNVQTKEAEKPAETKPAAVPDEGEAAPDTNNKPEDKKQEDKKPEGNSKNNTKPQPRQKTQTQNNNFNNSGVNNSFNNNSGTIIIDKSVHFGETKSVPTPSAEDTKPEDKSKAKKKEDTIKANKENYQVAHDEGKQVAKDLIGYTTQAEKARAIRNIMKQNENTIIGFMQGYYSEDSLIGIPFGIGELLDQVDNEYGWTASEKTRVFAKVIESTLKFAENTGNTENSNYKELYC